MVIRVNYPLHKIAQVVQWGVEINRNTNAKMAKAARFALRVGWLFVVQYQQNNLHLFRRWERFVQRQLTIFVSTLDSPNHSVVCQCQ